MREPIPFGKYLLLERLAMGGMAEVWLATERDRPGHRYALKRLLPTLADDPQFVTMFLDEARLGAELEHPGLVPVHDLGREGAAYYMAMDFVPGCDLRLLLARARLAGAVLPARLSAWIVARAAETLDHAHRAHAHDGRPLAVVHRDLSPANVLLSFQGGVYVIDFGIARAAFRAHREDAALRGKFGYLSPEQAQGLPVDRRADVFSLGTVLHEALTGHRLFTGPSDLAVLQRVRAAEVPPPSAQNPAVPPGLDAVVLRALSREPADRFPWAFDLAEALAPFGAGVGPGALAAELAVRCPDEAARELARVTAAAAAATPTGP